MSYFDRQSACIGGNVSPFRVSRSLFAAGLGRSPSLDSLIPSRTAAFTTKYRTTIAMPNAKSSHAVAATAYCKAMAWKLGMGSLLFPHCKGATKC